VEQVKQHASDVLKRGFSRATAQFWSFLELFGAFWSFLELFGAFWCTYLWHLDFVSLYF
jgi:hypothetical protein